MVLSNVVIDFDESGCREITDTHEVWRPLQRQLRGRFERFRFRVHGDRKLGNTANERSKWLVVLL